MAISLDRSHPEVVTEMRRLANQGKTLVQIRTSIAEKFNYITTNEAIKKWSGVDFSDVKRGVQLSEDTINEIKRLSAEGTPNKEIQEILGVGEKSVVKYKENVIPYLTPEQLAEEFPDLANRLLSSDQDAVRKARDIISHRRQRMANAEAKKGLLASFEFDPLPDEDIDWFARKRAVDTVQGEKMRSLLYKISTEPGPNSYIPYIKYAKLQRQGVDVPPILGRVYRGNFSEESTEAMRKIVYDKVYAYLKKGGNPNNIPFEFGHIIAMEGVDPETGKKFVSGYTNPANTEMQDVEFNRRQHNKVSQDLLKRLGYHTGKTLLNLKGLPFGIGAAATLGASMLPSQSAEASTVRGRMGENLTNPNWMFSMATGLPEDFLPGWRENYDARQRAQGQETLSEGLNRAGQDWRELGEGILNIPERARNLYGRVRSIFD
jgi:hypothetical protein